MSENKDITSVNLPSTDVVDSAVGMSGRRWYVAIVKHNTERQSAERLGSLGIETYLPVQKEIRVWRNGRKSKVDRIVIPATLFIHCTESQRREIVKEPYIYRFMTDKAAVSTAEAFRTPVAVIPEGEIRQLQFMLGQTDVPVSITERVYRRGDKVRIVRGSLKGLEGEIHSLTDGKSAVIVTLEHLGCAQLQIDPVNLEVTTVNRHTNSHES